MTNLRMAVKVMMLIAALGFGALAIRHWRAQGTPVLRGLGLEWNARAGRELMAGVAIAGLAMLGIFLVEVALGAVTASPRQHSWGELGSWFLGKAAASLKEEILMRGLLLSGLVLAIGLHFAWNFVQGPLLGFPVSGIGAGGLQQVHDAGPVWLSGGAYGPEAGLVGVAFRFVIIALVLLWLTSAWRHGKR